MPSTTPIVCDDDLDSYDKVKVSRLNSDTNSELSPTDWWRPDDPSSNETSPYTDSYLEITFDVSVNVESVTIKNDQDAPDEDVRLAVEFQAGDRAPYYPLFEDGKPVILRGKADSKIDLPPSLPAVTGLRVYLVSPSPNFKYQVVLHGCEEEGM